MSNLTLSKNNFQQLLRNNKELLVDHGISHFDQPVIKQHNDLDPRWVDGLRFDSILEAKRYSVLKLWQQAGLISDLTTQHEDTGKPQVDRKHRWTLVDAYTTRSGVKKRPVYYIDDFSYKINGIQIIEDYKGYERRLFINKKKAFEQRYPDINYFLNFNVQGWFPTSYPDQWRKLNAHTTV